MENVRSKESEQSENKQTKMDEKHLVAIKIFKEGSQCNNSSC